MKRKNSNKMNRRRETIGGTNDEKVRSRRKRKDEEVEEGGHVIFRLRVGWLSWRGENKPNTALYRGGLDGVRLARPRAEGWG